MAVTETLITNWFELQPELFDQEGMTRVTATCAVSHTHIGLPVAKILANIGHSLPQRCGRGLEDGTVCTNFLTVTSL